MSENRLEILQMLADGKIDAEQAAAMMNGAEAPISAEPEPPAPEMAKAPPPPPPIIEKQPEEVIEIEIDEEPLELSKVKADEATKASRQSKLRLVISGDPIQANVEFSLPESLLELGQQIGTMFSSESKGGDWSDLNFEVDAGEQHIHIYTENAS